MTPRPLCLPLPLLWLLAACTTVPDTLSQDPRVEALGRMDNLAVTALRTTEKNGFLGVQAEISNFAPSPQHLHYRFRWLDRSGLVVGGEEAWKVELLQPMDKKHLDTLAPTRQAADFRMVVQSPGNLTGQSDQPPGQSVVPRE